MARDLAVTPVRRPRPTPVAPATTIINRIDYSRSLGSAAITKRWVEKVYLKFLPLSAQGVEMPDPISGALVRPQTQRDSTVLRAPGMRGPNIDSIARALIDIFLAEVKGEPSLLPVGVSFEGNFQVRNLLSHTRHWHA